MSNVADRLKAAREAANYPDATTAAKAMGVSVPSYLHHENGTRGLSRAAPRYAKFFRVSLDWLLEGKGTMRGGRRVVPVHGLVGAGAAVENFSDPTSWTDVRHVEIPSDGKLAAYLVRGDSQWPRYLDGEFILYETAPRQPKDLLDQYAVVETLDGRRLVKMLRASGREDVWLLESHNAKPERATLQAAYAIVGTLAAGPPI